MSTTERGHRRNRARGRREGGFSLLESLFAMTILAFGLLGLAAMQTMALSYNVDAHELSAGTSLASEMMERIHYNRINVTNYNGALGTGIDTGNGATTPPAAQAIARGDYLQWQANLGNSGLDGAQGLVNVTNPFGPAALGQSQVIVQVVWQTKAQGIGADAFGNARKQSRSAVVRLQTVMGPP